MFKLKMTRLLSLIIAIVMFVSLLPIAVFAAGSVTNYSDFLFNFKQLEVYADEFGSTNNMDPGELVLNFIRTGVDRYQTGTWETLAGVEITAFTEYVEAQDSSNGTTVMDLRDIVIDDFVLPNGNPTDFGHMFGTMNISYVASAIQSDDLSGWAGDLCDLLYFSSEYSHVVGNTIEEKAAYILENCFGVNADDAFGWDDFYGDMDAFYLINEYSAGKGKFSAIMEEYFTADLDDTDRAIYFLNNRFAGVETKEDVRNAIYNAYRTNVGIQVLEADRGISEKADLRQASCYAFADYLFGKADGNLVGGGTDDDETDLPENGYYSVFSSTSSILAPGISQKINYATSADGKQMVYYVATVDVTRDDVTIMANYKDNDPSKGWGMSRVEDQVAALVKNHQHIENFTPVVATNGDGFNTTTGKPGGLLVMEGIEWNPVDKDGFFAILKDGTAMIGVKDDYETHKTEIQEAIGGFGAVLVKDGKIVATENGTRASRTAIGIKADGSVVMMVLDGRQEPFSCGGSYAEIATIMYEAGCVEAINLDGGGSTTYMSKPEGSDSIKVINRPSDGYARSVAASLVAVSTAKSSKEFDRAIINSDYEYLTVGTSVKLNAVGVNNIGSSAVIPDGAFWAVSDETIGEISNDGTFTATANGDVTVYFVVNGEIAGSKELHVVLPDGLSFKEKTIAATFDVESTVIFNVTYNGNDVAYNENDVYFGMVDSAFTDFLDPSICEVNGHKFTALSSAGVRNMIAVAQLACDEEGNLATANVLLYRSDETAFDFDNATAGNRTLAWLREVLNATTKDGINYSIVDPDKDMIIDYTFALDMTAIEIPKQLADIVFMLPGSDNGNASAFNYLLQLAERVSILTEVKIEAQFDSDVVIDVSELRIVNDYFQLTSATVDENNKLTVICNWIDRTQPIDPATANPVCILTGVKAIAKDGSFVDNELLITNTGSVSYDIYLRASSLYSFANNIDNQKKFGLYPYSTDKTGYEGGTESGAHFSGSYVDFEDGFVLENELRQGWYKEGSDYYYYVDHVAQTGLQYIPSRDDASKKLFYNFDENGACIGTVTGAIKYNGDLYYAAGGEMTTGWISDYDKNGKIVNYYFSPIDGKAVDGKQKIDGYNYTFSDYVLTRGDLITDSKGTRYRWAGKWLGSEGKYIWFEVDGKYYITGSYNPYVLTGFKTVPKRENTSSWGRHLFGDDGALRTDYVGLWREGSDIFYVKNGPVDSTVGLVYEEGHYYFISPSTGRAIKSTTYWVNKTNGLVPAGLYTFDENGKMTNPPVSPEQPEIPDVPDEPEEKLNGIFEVNGEYYYYVDGVQIISGGYKLVDEDGKEFYIYIRSATGTLATGKYWPADENGVFESKVYDFGTNGRYYPVNEEPEDPVDPSVKNGIYEENGKLRYYVNGVMHKGGVVKLADPDGRIFYIYVRTTTAALATGNYWPTVNEYLPSGIYSFGTDGKYYPPADVEPEVPGQPEQPELPEVPDEPDTPVEPEDKLSGLVEVDGKLYYYEDGEVANKFGLIQLTDENGETYYIYVRSSNKQVVTGKYWITITNGLLEAKSYDFGTDGKYYPA